MALEVSSTVISQILAEAARAHPDECCGILLGTAGRIEGILPAANVHPTPRTHFDIDPRALIEAQRADREGERQVLGYYHSHPTGEPAPSATDRAMAARDGMIWAIVAAGRVAFWRSGAGAFEPLPYEARDR